MRSLWSNFRKFKSQSFDNSYKRKIKTFYKSLNKIETFANDTAKQIKKEKLLIEEEKVILKQK